MQLHLPILTNSISFQHEEKFWKWDKISWVSYFGEMFETFMRPMIENLHKFIIFSLRVPKICTCLFENFTWPLHVFQYFLRRKYTLFKKAFKISDCILGMLLGVLHSIMHMSRKIAIRWSLIEMRRRRRASLLFPLSFCGSEFYYAM